MDSKDSRIAFNTIGTVNKGLRTEDSDVSVTRFSLINCGEGTGTAYRAGTAPLITRYRQKKGTDTSAIGNIESILFGTT